MSDTADTAAASPNEGAETPADGPAAPEAADTPGSTNVEADDTDTSPGGDEQPGREAAKYRRKLRDTESERDQLAQRLTVLQRSEVERLAAQHLADPADVWRDGLELPALLDGDGNIDPAKVVEAAKNTTSQHPHWRRPPGKQKAPAAGPTGLQPGTGRAPGRAPSILDAFRPRQKRADW